MNLACNRPARAISALVLATLLPAGHGLAFSSDEVSEIQYSGFAESFAERHEVSGRPGSEALVIEVLERQFAVIRLGVFDVYQARQSFTARDQAEQLEVAAETLLKVQERWLDWVLEDATSVPEDDFRSLHKWVRSWKLKKLAGLEGQAGVRPDLLDLLEAKDAVREAVGVVADYMEGVIGRPGPVKVVVVTTRQEFLEWGCYVGSFDETHRAILWNQGLASWVHFHEPGYHVLATEYPLALPGAGDFTQGQSMATFEKTGLEQHLAQQGTELLLFHRYGSVLPPQLRSGLGVNLAIELFGENNVRAGYGSVGQTIPGVNKFVRQGHSPGGQGRARRQQSRFRQSAGKDYFLGELRKAQKAGARLAAKADVSGEDRVLCFALRPDAGTEEHLVRAPFLSPGGYPEAIPEMFKEDCQEFLRAYRSAFALWLRSHAHGSRGDSEVRFGEFLRGVDLTAEDPAVAFEGHFTTMFGGPLGGADAGVERRFLEWLSKRR